MEVYRCLHADDVMLAMTHKHHILPTVFTCIPINIYRILQWKIFSYPNNVIRKNIVGRRGNPFAHFRYCVLIVR